MSRFTVRFDEKIANRLQKNSKRRGVTIADYIRNLVNIGLENEDGSDNKNSKNMMKEMLGLALHSNTLSKNIFLYVCDKSIEEKTKLIDESSIKVRKLVEEKYPDLN